MDKAKGETSFDVIRRVRRDTGEKKVGHAGTLDPLATGLLLVALGRGTKLLEYLIGCDKEYEVVGRFGYVSDSYDAEGEIVEVNPGVQCTQHEIEYEISQRFAGEIDQVPPKYSALKINGKRAADVMREGGDVEMKARKIKVDEFSVLDFNWPEVRFLVKCGSGTYVRSLIHDLGDNLGCGAYVIELRRTRIDDFAQEGEVSLDEMGRRFLVRELLDEEFEGLKDGKVLLGKKVEQDGPVMAYYKDKLVGVLENVKGGIKYKKVI